MNRLQLNKRHRKLRCFCYLLAGLLWLPYVSVSAEERLQITGVNTDRTNWKTGEKPISVNFHINKSATVILNIYDARDYLIHSITSEKMIRSGDHVLFWNGLDVKGSAVPPGAYVYTLVATTIENETVIFDLTDQTGGETVIAKDVYYDVENDVIRYNLPYSARMFVRVGIKNGSILRTLVNSVVRQAGMVEESWDGWDESSMVNLKNHPNLDIYAEGFRLSRNTIMVTTDKKNRVNPEWVKFSTNEIIKRKAASRPRGLNLHAYHVREDCRDTKIILSLSNTSSEGGVPVISSATEFRIDLAPQDSMMFESQRFEAVFYLNGKMIYENEVSYTPYTWTWNPQVIMPSINYMTAFIVGYGGHYAVSTVKFKMAKEKGSE